MFFSSFSSDRSYNSPGRRRRQCPLVHRPQVHHCCHWSPDHSSSLHPQRDWLPEVCQVEAFFCCLSFFLFTFFLFLSFFFDCSALSVMGTWYVTIVVIIKYIWPDKEVTPAFVPSRWNLVPATYCESFPSNRRLMLPVCLFQFFVLDRSLQCHAHHLLRLPGSPASSCCRAQLSLCSASPSILFTSPSPVSTVPRQLRAGVQQHEQEGDQTLGAGGDTQHDHLPLRLHRDR